MVGSDQLARALAAIDDANADDPNEILVRGARRPKELAHAELVSDWVVKLQPEASEDLLLAARAHHVRRWEIPRSDYPSGRRGYHRWRIAQHQHHAEIVGRILTERGYPPERVARVQDLVRKVGLGRDPEVQVLEDALCLVFLETQLHEISPRLEGERLEDVLRKTLRKMSPAAVETAQRLPLAAEHAEMLGRLAAEEDQPG